MSIAQTLMQMEWSPWSLLAMKATVAMLLALAITVASRHARASLRHAIYSALFVFLLLLPFSPRLLPHLDVRVPVRAAVSATEAPAIVSQVQQTAQQKTSPAAPAKRSFRWTDSLGYLYLAGVGLLLASLATSVLRLRRVAAGGEVWLDGTRLATDVACASQIRRAVLVVLSDEVEVPMTFGFRRATILLPTDAEQWDDDSLRRALRHELEHVRRDDWFLQLLARVSCAFYWPHPLVWMVWRRFCVEAERTCDDAVVDTFEPSSYAAQLVALARTLSRKRHLPALAMASPTRLTERVHAILDPTIRRGPHSRIATFSTLGVMGVTLLLFGAFRLVAQEVSNGQREAVRGGVSDGVRGGVNTDAIEDGVEGALASFRDEIIESARSGDIDRMQTFLDRGLDVNRSFDGDGTMLLIAARAGDVEGVRFLLDHGADPNVPSPGDGNPLIAAAGGGKREVVDLLLQRGARIDEVVPGDENALITASRKGAANVVRLLIDRGANVNARVYVLDSDDAPVWRTPLSVARRGGHTAIEQMLLAAGAHD
jgi:beta-lactamase regulating signal transducer with metallopeptidase domain